MDIKSIIFKCIVSAICTLGFVFVFKMKKSHAMWAVIGGVITCIIYIFSANKFQNEFIQNLIPSIFAAAYAEIIARLTRSAATPYAVCSVVILIPGALLYYSLYYLVLGQMNEFHQSFIRLLQTTFGIAVGIVLVTVVIREIKRRKFFITDN